MKKVYVSQDFMGNEQIKAALEHLSADPTDNLFSSRTYWDTTTERMRMYDGTDWIDVSGSPNMESSTTALMVDQTVKGTTSLSIAIANSTDAGLLSSAQYNMLNEATDIAVAGTIVKRSTSGTIKAAPPVDTDDVATKGYIGTLLASGMNIQGDIDCSTNPDYPESSAGDTYIVSAAGKIGGANGILVDKGDMIICTSTNVGGIEAEYGSSFSIQERNLTDATQETTGTVRFATIEEVAAGTSTTVVPSLYDVSTMIANGAHGFSADIPTGTATIVITHNFNTHAIAQVYDAVTNGTRVLCDIIESSMNSVTLTFTPAVTSTFLVNITKGGIDLAGSVNIGSPEEGDVN